MVRVLLCYLYIFYINLLCSRSLFFVSFFYFITDKPLRHFLFDDRGKGKYSTNRTKYKIPGRLFKVISGFLFSPLSIPRCCRLTSLLIPNTSLFLVSSLFWCSCLVWHSACIIVLLYTVSFTLSTPHFFFTTSII